MYEVKKYNLENVGKISNKAMQMHFVLYEGYVKNVNLIVTQLSTLTPNSPEWNELHRRFGWEFNGMRLHELFFDCLSNIVESPNNIEGEIKVRIKSDFESIEKWKNDFTLIAKMRGMGWAMLVEDKKTKKLLNTWVNEHDAGMMSDVNILLCFDMFEHAYVPDFGTDRSPYLESLFAHVDWEVVSKRLSN